ncbi:hypothetical protein ACFUJR_36860 [Streptomyces sp. NPDC057271]|uniref:hypothetical protein n=1 Tax=unclassified Streptomyces TaxID=2593676 RepID=UPI00362D6654
MGAVTGVFFLLFGAGCLGAGVVTVLRKKNPTPLRAAGGMWILIGLLVLLFGITGF